jgi:predicted lipoprotein
MADGFIIPAYNQLLKETQTLDSKAEAFNQSSNQENLTALQTAWISAYSTWQKANSFNFGPAGEEGTRKTLLEEIALFPVSESKINSILESNSFNINDFNRDARGFLAIEYLIFDAKDDNEKILNTFKTDSRKTYLKALTNHIQERVKFVADAWNGNYKSQFLNANGTESGSSTSTFYNEFVKSFEALKNFKVGLPLGKRPGQTNVMPELVEARYSGKSLEFLKLHIQNLDQIWKGKSYNSDADGVGFNEYLQSVEGGKELINLSESQMLNVTKSVYEITTTARFSDLLVSEPSKIETLHTELQKQTRFFKSDMSSVLGIAITYSSGDGD